MPTVRVTDTAGQAITEPAVVEDDEPVVQAADIETMAAALDMPPENLAGAARAPEAEFSAEQTAAIERLRRLGSRRVKLREELEAVDRELLGDAILAAFKLGVPKRLIARESQVVRQTVYNVIERADA